MRRSVLAVLSVVPLLFLPTGAVAEGNTKTLDLGVFAKPAVSIYPPTLFSDANYQASCEGMAARDMKNFSGDIGFQTFYQGIYLVHDTGNEVMDKYGDTQTS